ncbi:MAG: PAS domain S-box protein, partial [Rhodoferax sp.]|nr:PAS domain S-box protein [Rhodoferax sp.]
MALVLKGANDGWWDWDLMTGERYYAPRGWDMLGYAEDEAPDDGRLWERLIHPEDAPRVQVIFDTAIQGRGSHYSAEFRLRHRGGHFVPVLSRGYILRDDQGRAIRLSGTNTDLSQRKEAEQSLRSEKMLNQQIIDASPIGIGIYDSLGDCTAANAALLRQIGGTLDGVKARNYHDIAAWRNAGLYRLATETQRSGKPSSQVVRIRTSFDKDAWLSVAFNALDPGGSLMVTTYDLSDFMHARQMREASEKRFEMLFVNSMDGVLQTEVGGAILGANPAACQMLDRSEEELLQPGAIRSVFDFDDPRLAALIEKRARTGRAAGEVTLLRRGGARFEVELSSVTYASPDGQALSSLFFRDITERMERETALRIKDGAIASSLNGIAFAALDATISYVNAAFLRMWGYTREDQVLGRSVTEFWRDPGAARKALSLVTLDDNWSGELTAQRADGSCFDSAVSAVAIRDERGAPVHLMASFVDVTEAKRAAQELRDLNEALDDRVRQRTAQLQEAKSDAERANQAKSEFLSRMSHELRTPLNAILGFGQLLALDVRDREQSESVREILLAGQHLLDLINEVLDLARVESGKFTVSLEPVPLAALVAECVTLMGPLAEARGVRIHEAQCERSEHVLADRTRLKQVLLNLLSNAVKYNRKGGEVRMDCAPSEGGLQIRISDTGAGLSAEQQARLFMPFERLDADRTGVEGTGIGLALSKRLVEHMQGAIGVHSALGMGSTFWVRLPRANGRSEPVAIGLPAGTQQGAGPGAPRWRDVLCIEDNPANLRLIERILGRRADIRLVSASAPGLGLELARSHRPALILLDINLPDMDGYAVMQCLRENAAT